MQPMKFHLKLLIAFVLTVGGISAADFSGTWLGEVPVGNNNGAHLKLAQSFAVKLVQSGSAVTGKLYGDYESPAISEGKVTDDSIDFIVVSQEQQGNQINQTRLHFTGKLNADGNIEITRVRESATNAGNNGAFKFKETNNKQTFVLKRLP